MEHNIESTSQNIGPMEYAIQTSVSMTKCMLKVLKLKKLLWMEAVVNVIHTLNRCPTKVLHSVTPLKNI